MTAASHNSTTFKVLILWNLLALLLYTGAIQTGSSVIV